MGTSCPLGDYDRNLTFTINELFSGQLLGSMYVAMLSQLSSDVLPSRDVIHRLVELP